MSKFMIGKKVNSILIADDKKAIKLNCDDGEYVVRVDGDCCSQSWIEHVELPALGLPFTITSIEGLDMGKDPIENDEFEYLQFYGCKVSTDKGDMVIDYRNESNGYYGGDIIWPDDYFCNGVYGQNVSSENWIELKEDI